MIAAVGIVLGWGGWWMLALWPLTGYWATNPQYTYGWLVPPMAILLAWHRWRTRPKPDEPAPWSAPLMFASAATVFPAWVILQPNLGWRLVPWFLVLSAAAGTVALFARLGGKSWAQHFAFPIFFTITAIPWPRFQEETVVQGLMRFVAGVTVTLMNVAGLPAAQRGNLIEVATGVLGVNEACSGVRSLQAALMVALFLGEFYRLTKGARVVLVAAGFISAVLTNIARTTFLSFSAARGGINAVGQWHDPAGYMVLTICFVIIAIFANWLRIRHGAQVETPTASPAHLLPTRAGFILTGWVVFVLAATETWYFRPPRAETLTWTLALPPGAREEPLPPSTLELLSCDHYHAANWRDALDAQWTIFFLEWDPSSSHAALRSRMHRPEVCLPGLGLAEAGPRRMLMVPVAGFDLAFESLHFRDMDGHDEFVFFCPWEIVPGQPGYNAAFNDATRTSCLRRVWQRERVLGRQVVEIIIAGAPAREAAEASVRKELGLLIRSSATPALR